MNPITIKVINESGHPLPQYASEQAAGFDVLNPGESFSLAPLERRLVKTGLYFQLPVGYEAQVRPRSGLALKHGLSVLNSPGTIDSDYRGEVGVILVNLSNEVYTVEQGERVAQIVIARHEHARLEEVEMLDETVRGAGGFGSTGKR